MARLGTRSRARCEREDWLAVDGALRQGKRGRPRGGSLTRFLEKEFGQRHPHRLRRTTPAQIRKWAKAHFARAGKWPTRKSAAIPEMNEVTWSQVDAALRQGLRGLPAGSSLADFLEREFGRVNPIRRPRFSTFKILKWSDAFRSRHGRWPTVLAGDIPESPGDSWRIIDGALRSGLRGLPRGSSLAGLLREKRGKWWKSSRERLTEQYILDWADAYHRKTGSWPEPASGAIAGTVNETWARVAAAMRGHNRGLSGPRTLAMLLKTHRSVVHKAIHKPLLIGDILAWADLHFQRTGEWPTALTKQALDEPTETWSAIDKALREGGRGLPPGSSLFRLLRRERGARRKSPLKSAPAAPN